MHKSILELKNISYSYESGNAPALKDVSVSIGKNERIAVIGNNGAGKSTFFLCCNGILKPDKGELYLQGEKVKYNRKGLTTLRENVGVVFQDPNQQFIAASVKDDISFGPMNLKLELPEVEKRVEQAMQDMNLEELQERPPHYLSGGEKKRLSIAGVIAMHPKVILFDEPTASLDHLNTKMLEDVLEELSANSKTVVVSTHDIDFAWRWASRVLLFNDGYLIADNTPEKIFGDQKLLKQVSIEPPALLRFMKLLHNKDIITDTSNFPKTLDELNHIF